MSLIYNEFKFKRLNIKVTPDTTGITGAACIAVGILGGFDTAFPSSISAILEQSCSMLVSADKTVDSNLNAGSKLLNDGLRPRYKCNAASIVEAESQGVITFCGTAVGGNIFYMKITGTIEFYMPTISSVLLQILLKNRESTSFDQQFPRLVSSRADHPTVESTDAKEEFIYVKKLIQK
jgi:hypothetical protein